MALSTPYEFDQDPVTHPLGEKIVSVADPLNSAPGATTYYLARRFEFTEGNYRITVTADDAATVWIGTTQLNSRIVASPTLAIPGEAFLYIPLGAYRLDVILQNLSAPPSPCYFTMIIADEAGKVVYTSAAEGWLMDEVAISDDDLPLAEDYRLLLPVWSMLPNWKNGITERLSWLTDVLSSETDAEQRRSVRRNARRSFECSFMRERAQRDRLDNFFVGVGPSTFMWPMFHEQVKMNEGIDMEASGVTFPDGDFQLREFREGDLVFVNAGDPDDYDILKVGDVEANRFSWAFPPPRAWPAGTRIFPMRETRINTQAPKMSNVTATLGVAQVLFDMVEPYEITASWGANVGGEPLFRFVPDRAKQLDVEYDRRSYVLDNQSGAQAVVDHGRFTTAIMQFNIRLFGRGTAYLFRQFLQAARGRSVHFYCPTFMQDIEPLGDIIGGVDELVIKPQGFYSSMLRPQPIRIRLAFQFRDGSQTLYRVIENVAPVYLTNENGEAHNPLRVVAEALILDEPLPAIELVDLKRISFLCESRFEQDQFEIHHPTNGQEVIDVALVMRQATNQRNGPPT
jgi:hypothetical protein